MMVYADPFWFIAAEKIKDKEKCGHFIFIIVW